MWCVGLSTVCLSHPVCFPFLFSLQHPLFSSLFSRGNHQIFPEAGLGPKSAKSAKYQVFCGYTWKNPGIPGKSPGCCRFPRFCLRFCPRPALRLRETREFPEWSTKHPLFSLEISGNAKCWGPSVFLFICRKTSDSPKFRALPATRCQSSGPPGVLLSPPRPWMCGC